MTQNNTLEKIREFAAEAHKGQKRKYTPEPYIVHPVRVMELCGHFTTNVCILAAALLHDVLEDTSVTENEMLNFLRTVMDETDAADTLVLVRELTDVYTKADYPRYNRRERKEMERQRIEKTSADSQTVKYADIIDNCREIVKHDRDFARVFLSECRAILRLIRQGDPKLCEQAVELVEQNIEKLRPSLRR